MESRKHYDPYRKILLDPREEIVISGISGRFPESNNLYELRDNLMNKVDLITDDNRRWKLDHVEIPQRVGKIDNLSKFDADYFGIHFKHAHTMDPMSRIAMEHAYEAIIDAGVNPEQLRGTKTGVFVGVCFSETEMAWIYDRHEIDVQGAGLTGCCRALLSNRISYWLGIHGPSYTIDSACSSSLHALEHAYRALRTGVCDYALVGGANLILHPNVSLQFARLGVLSHDGRSKSFDNRANGYVRSESISMAFLQKAKDAKRIYATVVHGKTNCDGFKPQGITFPSSEVQSVLLQDFYTECQMPPSSLEYLEAHGTGTKVGDPEELNAIDSVFCPKIDKPLKIGSVKSNLGHCEAASGMCQVAKVIIGYETGLIPPNLYYEVPREGVPGLLDGRLKVVTEPTPWNGGYAGISSFGFGGANAHILLKSNLKEKINNGAPQDHLPRLVCISGRTKEAVDSILTYIENRPVDIEYIRLLQDLHAQNLSGHLYRGYTILSASSSGSQLRSNEPYRKRPRPVWFLFSGISSQWPTIGIGFLEIPVFANAMQSIHAVLKPHGINIYEILTNQNQSTFDKPTNFFVGSIAVQIGLVDLLKSLGIFPDTIVGHSFGELICAYTDGSLTAEQTILAAYNAALAVMKFNKIRGSMAVVSLGYQQIQPLCPPDIVVTCHNGPQSTAISGPADTIKTFVAKLLANNIFAEEITCSNMAYHSRYLADVGPQLFAYLKRVIPDAEPRSAKWLSTSIPEFQWSSSQAKLSSAEYFTNNLLAPVLFEEIIKYIPKDAVIIEFMPNTELSNVQKSLNHHVTSIALTQHNSKDNVQIFLQAIGRLYQSGLQPTIWGLYPEVKFPVSRGTPMISPLIKWDHSEDWFVTAYKPHFKLNSGERLIELNLTEEEYEYMAGHVIDGKNLLPATGYLSLVWETMGMMSDRLYTELSIIFEDVKFLRATTLVKDVVCKITVMIQRGSGKFEVIEGGAAVVTGTVRPNLDSRYEEIDFRIPNHEEQEVMSAKDIYKEFRLRGYQYSGLFKALKSATTDGSKGTIHWANNWVAFMDNMLQVGLLGHDTRALLVPTGIRKLTINAKRHYQQIRNMPPEEQEFKVYSSKKNDVIVSGGVQIRGLQASAINRRKPAGEPVLETYKFVAHRDRTEIPLKQAVILATHLALENQVGLKIKTLEILQKETNDPEELLSVHIYETLANCPMLQTDVNVATTENNIQVEGLPDNIIITDLKRISPDLNPLILAGRDLLAGQCDEKINQLMTGVKDGAFVLSLETSYPGTINLSLDKYGFHIVLEKVVKGTTLLLLRKIEKPLKIVNVIEVTNEQFFWLNTLKTILKKENERKIPSASGILLISDKSFENGLLGLVNCLRREPGGALVRGLVIQDPNAPHFSLSEPLYADQLKLNLSINVLRPRGTWGSYRHLPLGPPSPRPVHQAYVNQLVKGDLTSFQWLQGPITSDSTDGQAINVVYSALNFKDIMLATGKLAAETTIKHRSEAECVLGIEYSGITSTGCRVMGLISTRGLTNVIRYNPYLCWRVPDDWTLEDAATVPCVYGTCVYALNVCGKMKKGDRILIHSGTGGIGQAAIHLALWTGCEVFTTVGSTEKRQFIRETYPQIPDDHIGNSRDTSFEQMVMEKTNGKGVDLVLNSLADDKLQASVRCLADGGSFLEIGKFDMANNTLLEMAAFSRGIKFYGIFLDKLFYASEAKKMKFHGVMQRALDDRALKPLPVTTYPKDKIEPALRYMAAGKHIGKIIIKIQDEQNLGAPIIALPQYHCRKGYSYIILGGLGGFGLELADWLILRGAQHIIVTSRSGIKNGYQLMRIKLWRSYGVKVIIISGKEASNLRDCEEILSLASNQAPVDAIYNLAVVLKDSLLENQTPETFEESFKAKAWSTKNLDKLSRRMCPKLRHFVVFSSVSCGRGNAGQTNYGMSNSVMERICERRAAEGLPGLAIQWGAVGDVGLVADMQDDDKELVIGGTLQQKIISCLHELDGFLNQSSPVVASMVVAEKRAGGTGSLNVVDTVLNIMGFKDLKSISQHTSLAELGMDSMMAVEIKQTLEREFELFLTPQDIRSLNFTKLSEFISKDGETGAENTQRADETNSSVINMLVKVLGVDETTMNQPYVKLSTKEESSREEVFVIPGIEGIASVFMNIAPKIRAPTTCLQLNHATDSVADYATTLLPYILKNNPNRKEFLIVAYSFGSLVALELVRSLEGLNYSCKLILIDGSPEFFETLYHQLFQVMNSDDISSTLLMTIMDKIAPAVSDELSLELKKCTSWEEKLETYVNLIPKNTVHLSRQNQRNITTGIYKRFVAFRTCNSSKAPFLKSSIVLLKPTIQSIKNLSFDYGLTKLTTGTVEIHTLEGSHATILDNPKVADVINGDVLDDTKR